MSAIHGIQQFSVVSIPWPSYSKRYAGGVKAGKLRPHRDFSGGGPIQKLKGYPHPDFSIPQQPPTT